MTAPRSRPFPDLSPKALRALALAVVVPVVTVAVPAQFNWDDAIHITNRIGFGSHSGDRAAVMANYASWLNQQLNAGAIPDPDIDALYPVGTFAATIQDLQTEQVVRALASNRRLQETMTYFWERHFNTSYDTVVQRLQFHLLAGSNAAALGTRLEAINNLVYRNNCLSTFQTLLFVTTFSSAMTLYLDNHTNTGCQGNENYAREFLELYSMGPIDETTGLPNYVHSDIDAVAACFSGWAVDPTYPTALIFNAGNHCPNPQTLFSHPSLGGVPVITINPVGNGQNQLWDLVSAIAAKDATKDFICRKLARHFLSDAGGSPTLIANMKTAWGTTGDIQAVLFALLNSSEFTGITHRWKRASTPFERVVWWQRTWNAVLVDTVTMQVDITKANVMRDVAAKLGERLFRHPPPDGYPMDSDEQVTAAGAITSWDYAAMLRTEIGPGPNFYAAHPTVVLALLTVPQTNPGTIANILLTHLYGSSFTGGDLQEVTLAIERDHTGVLLPPLTLGAGLDYAERLAIGAATAGAFFRAQLR